MSLTLIGQMAARFSARSAPDAEPPFRTQGDRCGKAMGARSIMMGF